MMPTSKPTRISLIRHGHVHNPDLVIYGRLPGFELSTLGRQQAQAAAEFLRDKALSALFSSPLLRARQTADIVRAYHNDLPLHIAEPLNEVNFLFEGRPMRDMAARNWDLYTGIPEGYEQPGDVVARVRQFLAKVRADYAGQTVALVSHGDVIAFTALWAYRVPLIPANKHTLDALGLSDDYPATGSITTLVYHAAGEDERPTVEYVRPYGNELMDRGTSPK